MTITPGFQRTVNILCLAWKGKAASGYEAVLLKNERTHRTCGHLHDTYTEAMECPKPALPVCSVCATPGDFSCYSVTALWDRQHPQRHIHVCPPCVMEENLGEPIGTRASSCAEV